MRTMINYLEIPTRDLSASKAFFSTAFAWSFTDYGPDYATFTNAGIDGGFHTSETIAATGSGSVLIVLYSRDLDQSMAEVRRAGGVITKPIFAFPGGRRFHFNDPGGSEFAVWSDAGQ